MVKIWRIRNPDYELLLGDPVLAERAEEVPKQEITGDKVQDVIHRMIYALGSKFL